MTNQLNDWLAYFQALLSPLRYWLIILSVVYILGLLAFHLHQMRNAGLSKIRYLMRILHFGIAVWFSNYSVLLTLTNSDLLTNLYWVVPLCTCPLPFALILILSIERFVLREARDAIR